MVSEQIAQNKIVESFMASPLISGFGVYVRPLSSILSHAGEGEFSNSLFCKANSIFSGGRLR